MAARAGWAVSPRDEDLIDLFRGRLHDPLKRRLNLEPAVRGAFPMTFARRLGVASWLLGVAIAVLAAAPLSALGRLEDRPRAELVPQVGHQSFVFSVAYSPDGSRVASGDSVGVVRIWDPDTEEETVVLAGHAGGVNALAYSPLDGSRIASAGDDGTVRIWDARTGAELDVLTGHADGVNAVAYSPDGSRIASSGYDGTVRIWDPQKAAQTRAITADSEAVLSVTYSPDGSKIAWSGSDGVRIWDVRSEKNFVLIRTIRWARSVTYSPDGSRIVAVSDEGPLRIFDAETGEETKGLEDDVVWVSSVAYSPDGRRIATGSRGDVVQIWDAETGAETAALTGHKGGVNAIAYSPDGRHVVAGSHDGSVRIWNAETGTETAAMMADDLWLSSVVYHPDGSRVAVASDDRTVLLLAADTGVQTLVLDAQTPVLEERLWIMRQVAYSPDGGSIAGSHDGGVLIFDAETGELKAELKGHEGIVSSVAYSPDGSRLASGSGEDGTLRIWDAETRAETVIMSDGDGYVGSVAYSPDGSQIASVSYRGTIRIWDAKAGSEVAVWQAIGGTSSVAYSPDGRSVMAGNRQGVWILDTLTGEPRVKLSGHESMVQSVAYSPDGRNIASGSDDGTVRVWDAGTGRQMLVLTGAGLVNSVAYGPHGTHVAAAAYGGSVRIWQVGEPTPAVVHQRFPGRRWIAYRPGRLRYVANVGAERHMRIRFDGHRCPIFRLLYGGSSCPVYPLEWYRDQLRVDPQDPDLRSALQREDPQIRPKELRLVWKRVAESSLVFGVVSSAAVLAMLWITVPVLRHRRTPLGLVEEFFGAASDYQVERRLTSHALLLQDRRAANHYAVLHVNGADQVATALGRRIRRSKDVPLLFLIQPTTGARTLPERAQAAQRIRVAYRVNVVPMALATMERALKTGSVNTEVNAAKDRYVTRHDPYYESIPVKDPTLFFGRSAQLQTIPRLLSQGQHVGIFGLRKTGKTSLAHQLRLRFRDVPVASIDCQQLDRHLAAPLLLAVAGALRTDLQERFEVRDGGDPNGHPGSQLRSLIDSWHAHGRSEPFVVVLDEVDRLLAFDEPNASHDLLVEGRKALGVLRALAQELSGVVLVAIAKRPDVNRTNRLPADAGENPMFMGFREVYAGGLSADECDTMIRELGAWRGIEWEPEALRRLHHYCGGHPFVARLFASDACEQGRRTTITVDRAERTADTIRTTMRTHLIGKVYRQIFTELRKEERELVERIAAGSESLNESLLSPTQGQALADLEHFGLVNGKNNLEIWPKLFEYGVKTGQFA